MTTKSWYNFVLDASLSGTIRNVSVFVTLSSQLLKFGSTLAESCTSSSCRLRLKHPSSWGHFSDLPDCEDGVCLTSQFDRSCRGALWQPPIWPPFRDAMAPCNRCRRALCATVSEGAPGN
eukprot:gene1594-biopygen11007